MPQGHLMAAPTRQTPQTDSSREQVPCDIDSGAGEIVRAGMNRESTGGPSHPIFLPIPCRLPSPVVTHLTIDAAQQSIQPFPMSTRSSILEHVFG
jgi:hypothetical protein